MIALSLLEEVEEPARLYRDETNSQREILYGLALV
jgi:hypothetical protein